MVKNMGRDRIGAIFIVSLYEHLSAANRKWEAYHGSKPASMLNIYIRESRYTFEDPLAMLLNLGLPLTKSDFPLRFMSCQLADLVLPRAIRTRWAIQSDISDSSHPTARAPNGTGRGNVPVLMCR